MLSEKDVKDAKPWKMIHMAINLDYAIRILKREDNRKAELFSIGGKFPTSEVAIKAIREWQEKGYDSLPIGDCDNYDKKGRCKGHPVKKGDLSGT